MTDRSKRGHEVSQLEGQAITPWHPPVSQVTPSGREIMLTVKLTKSWSTYPQDTGLDPFVNPPCWASETAVSLNLTIPGDVLDILVPPRRNRHAAVRFFRT